MIAILDYKAGNQTSVLRALKFLGIPSVITADSEVLARADGIIFPGVGSSAQAMDVLRGEHLDLCLADAIAHKQPVLGICLGTACYVKNSQAIVDKFSALLGIAPGETTDDGLFTIEAVRCIGACALAPAMTINGKVYPKVTPDQVGMIIDEYRKKEEAN